jgi:hypothetical protein
MSSHELGKEQVDTLAKEIKQELKAHPAASTEKPKTSVAPQPKKDSDPKPVSPPAASHGIAHIRHEEVGHENTIYIDREGNFSYAGSEDAKP